MVEIEVKKIPEQKLAYVPHTDSFSKLPEFIKEVGELIAENNLEAVGLPYGSYENDMEERAETTQMFEVGMPVKNFDIDGKPAARIGKLGLKELTEHTVIAARHKGSHKNFDKTIKAMVNYAIENHYDIVGPITEIYIPTPEDAPIEDVETEVHLPVIYMGPRN